MSNISILYDNLADAGTYGPGSATAWNAAYPLTNLKHPHKTKIARSASAAAGPASFIVNLGASKTIDMLALIGHNLTTAATIHWVYSPDSGFVTRTINANIAIGAESSAVGTTYHKQPVPQTGQYVWVYIHDAANPAGYVQAGRFMAGLSFTPAQGISWGAEWQLIDPSEMLRGPAGVVFTNKKPQTRRLAVSFQALTHTEAFGLTASMTDLIKKVGIGGNCFVMYDTADTGLMRARRSIYATIVEIGEIVEQHGNPTKPHGWRVVFEELL